MTLFDKYNSPPVLPNSPPILHSPCSCDNDIDALPPPFVADDSAGLCESCKGPGFWEDGYGGRHCVKCDQPPALALVVKILICEVDDSGWLDVSHIYHMVPEMLPLMWPQFQPEDPPEEEW